MTKVLVDTNVLIYSIDEDSLFYDRARSLLNNPDFHLFTTSKNLLEFMVVATRSSGFGLPTNIALSILTEIIQSIDIVYPTEKSISITPVQNV